MYSREKEKNSLVSFGFALISVCLNHVVYILIHFVSQLVLLVLKMLTLSQY